MLDTGACLHTRHRLLLVLLVCLALPLVGGCSGDPECFAVPFLPKCFDDDDDEGKQPDNTAPQTTSSLVTPTLAAGSCGPHVSASARSHRDASPEGSGRASAGLLGYA